MGSSCHFLLPLFPTPLWRGDGGLGPAGLRSLSVSRLFFPFPLFLGSQECPRSATESHVGLGVGASAARLTLPHHLAQVRSSLLWFLSLLSRASLHLRSLSRCRQLHHLPRETSRCWSWLLLICPAQPLTILVCALPAPPPPSLDPALVSQVSGVLLTGTAPWDVPYPCLADSFPLRVPIPL